MPDEITFDQLTEESRQAIDTLELLVECLRSEGFPSDAELAEVLRGPCELPREVRLYVADRIEGKLKKGRGRPKKEDVWQTNLMVIDAKMAVLKEKPNRTRGDGDLVTAVVKKLSDEGKGMSASSVRNVLYPKGE